MSEPAVAGVTRRKLVATRLAPAISLRRWRVLAGVLAGAALTMEAASLVVMVANSATTDLSQLGFNGIAILDRRPDLPDRRVARSRRGGTRIRSDGSSSRSALALTATLVVGQYDYYGRVVRPGAVPLTDLASWLGIWTWVPGFVLVFVLVLLFPDGSLPSRRWRPVLWLAAVAAVLMAVPAPSPA